MAEQDPEDRAKGDVDEADQQKLTAFGEPLWLDILKTVGVGLTLLLFTILIGGALGIAIMAPWGRASHDCSIYCVLQRQIESLFAG